LSSIDESLSFVEKEVEDEPGSSNALIDSAICAGLICSRVKAENTELTDRRSIESDRQRPFW
jgi:hypothetical protein